VVGGDSQCIAPSAVSIRQRRSTILFASRLPLSDCYVLRNIESKDQDTERSQKSFGSR
jgi:hypothetical protein